jgi:HK97 gp10 family phage protein
MSRGVSIQVDGLDRLKKKFGSLPENLKAEVDAELASTANEFVNRAVSAAPVDTGFLRNQITFTRLGEMNYEVVSGARYSAYLEFGTITRVSVPSDLVEYAAFFKGKGIRKNGGIYPHPFFFPQLPIAQAQLNKNLKEVVKSALEK